MDTNASDRLFGGVFIGSLLRNYGFAAPEELGKL